MNKHGPGQMLYPVVLGAHSLVAGHINQTHRSCLAVTQVHERAGGELNFKVRG
ncbi:MAG: hypothetical protein ACI9HY_004438 [Planctomycetaceae bacterium]|jgi:hypothetical protein